MTTEVFLKRKKYQIRLYEYVCCLNNVPAAAWGFEVYKLGKKGSVPTLLGSMRGYVAQVDAVLDAGAAVDALASRKIKVVGLDYLDEIREARQEYQLFKSFAQAA